MYVFGGVTLGAILLLWVVWKLGSSAGDQRAADAEDAEAAQRLHAEWLIGYQQRLADAAKPRETQGDSPWQL